MELFVKIAIQLGLAAFGLTAMWLSMGNNSRGRRWGPIIGLCGQPFWIAFALRTDAFGLLLLSLVYSAVYLRGIRVQWSARR